MESRLAKSDNGSFTPVQFVDYGAEAFSSHLLFGNPRTGAPRPLVGRGEACSTGSLLASIVSV